MKRILKIKFKKQEVNLAKLRVDGSKGTLRKESGKIKALRHDIARMLTRQNEMKNK